MAEKKKKKAEPTDLFGNPIATPAENPTRRISPKMEKYREYFDRLTVEQLHKIRITLGFEFKKGGKYALVSAVLAFFSYLEDPAQFKQWFDSLPSYLSRAIEVASFNGYIRAKELQETTGKPVLVEKRYYYGNLQINPDLRLAIFDLYSNYDVQLLFMVPLFRQLFLSRLPTPAGYEMVPGKEQNLSGWSAADTLSESMPLLLKAIDQLLEDRSIHEKILRRGLPKRDIKELRKSSAFPDFPLGAAAGIDPIELITRFLIRDPELSYSSGKKPGTKDVRDYLKEIIKSFFTIPASGEIRSRYFTINSTFEFSVLCPHLSKKPGTGSYRLFLDPFPRARNIFSQVIAGMAKTGAWYNLDEVARSLRMQALPFFLLENASGSSEIILKGEELRLPEGTLKIDPWEKGFVPDIFLDRHLMIAPLLKGYSYLMAALGLLEIVEGEPAKRLKKNGKLIPISPYDGLTYARITPFGAWCFDVSQEKPQLREVHYEAIADRELPLVTYRGHSLECRVFLERIGEPIGEDRFRITDASFIRDCSSFEDIERRIDEFHRLVAKEPAPHWEELFFRVKERSRLFDHEEQCMMIQLPADGDLRRLILEEKKLSSLVVRAEGGRIVVRTQDYKKLRKALEEYGVLRG
ncbi:MAG: hypothetical protein SVR04_01375 [Spirochaetota bacterium]|nr:hypothetical protein [Spirochaetota bacterium]